MKMNGGGQEIIGTDDTKNVTVITVDNGNRRLKRDFFKLKV